MKDAADRAHAIVQSQGGHYSGTAWDESRHPRHPAGSSEGGEFAAARGVDRSGLNYYQGVYYMRREDALALQTEVGGQIERRPRGFALRDGTRWLGPKGWRL